MLKAGCDTTAEPSVEKIQRQGKQQLGTPICKAACTPLSPKCDPPNTQQKQMNRKNDSTHQGQFPSVGPQHKLHATKAEERKL